MSNGESFGQRVKNRRRELGLTQDELAHRVGCAPITIRKIEHDDLRSSVQIAERLAMALAIPLEERAAFVRLARTEHIPEPITPTPMPHPDEIGSDDLSGRAIRGYALGERLGTGGMGVVYRAIQPLVEREVAVKIILPQYANQPDFIRRFEAEAQLIARLEHPHIVPLYDYWREPGVAYLIMRLLRGGSVRALLENGLLHIDVVTRIMTQIGQALSAAHRVGVVHRDLKPANVLLDEDGNAYLADFGIAKNLGNPNLENLTQADAIVGSPDYISPEQIRSEFVRPQTDIYCLGVMLYELLTGALPFRGPTPIEVMHEHLTAPLPPLAAHRAGLPAALDRVIQQATAKDPLQRYPDVDALLADWRRALGGTVAVPSLTAATIHDLVDADNPYKGLHAFAEGDAADFFGRETLTAQLLARLGEGGDLARFLAVVGPSGCGKSSVVRAGLVPALRRGGLPGSDKWFIVEFIPGAHPFEELEAALLRVAVNPPESLLGQLREDKRGLLRAVRRCLPDDPDVELVLVIDQFEEVFTLVQDESARAHLLDSLVTAALDERSRVRLVLTLRADFIDRPLSYVDFGELLRQRMELVLPLTPDELDSAITCPAEHVGLQWEPGLVAAIIHDVGDQPGALPLLQYALTGLFDKRDGRQLTKAAYQVIGGVLGALGRRAEDVYAGLDKSAQALARQVFLRLVTLGEGVGNGLLSPDTRRRVLRSELESLSRAITTVIDAFGRHRLLSFDRDPVTRRPTVEVAHEALLREWPRLRDWLSASRADVRLQRQLAAAAGDWQTGNRDPSFLLAGARLAQFEGWAASTDLVLTHTERAFLDASLAERHAQQTAEAARQKRELEAAQKLAETEKRRAEEQTRSATRLHQRAVYLALALGAAILLLVATLGLAQLSNQNLVAARAANTQAVAEVRNRSTAEANAQAQRNTAVGAQATAQAEAYSRATAEAQAQGERNTALNAQATAQAEAQVRATAEANAVQARANAEQQAALAFARELDAAAELQLATDPQRSLLLALQAISVTRSADLGTPWDVQQTLHDVMPAQRVRWRQEVPGFHAQVAYSADGKRITFTCESDTERTCVIDAATRQTLQIFKGFLFAYSPDGKLLATGPENPDTRGVARLWDTVTGRQVVTLTGSDQPLDNFALHGDTLVGGIWAADVWDLRAWRAAGAPEGVTLTSTSQLSCYNNPYYYGGLTFSPDGRQLAAVCNLFDNSTVTSTVKVYDMPSGKLLSSLGHLATVMWDVVFSPDGQRLATALYDGTARIWDAATGQELLRVNPGHGIVWNVAFSPDGQRLAAVTDELVTLWDVNTGVRLLTLPNPGKVLGLAFSPDGQRLVVTMNGMLQEWDVTPEGRGELAVAPRPPLLDFNNSHDGSRFAMLTTNGFLTAYEAATLQPVWATTAFTGVHNAGFLYTGMPCAGSYCGPETVSNLLSFNADNSRLLAGNIKALSVWTMPSHSPLWVAPGDLVADALSPDGQRLAYTDGYPPATVISVRDATTQKPLQTLAKTLDCVYSIEFSPDGSRLAAAGTTASSSQGCNMGGQVYIWDLKGGTIPVSPSIKLKFDALYINHINFSPDGQRLAAAGNTDGAIVWDLMTARPVFTLPAALGLVSDINFSPDGKYVVTGSANKVVQVWDAQTGAEVLSYPMPEVLGYRAFFTPGNKAVVIASSGQTVRLNAFLDSDALVAEARRRLLRDWQPGECLKYLHTETCPARP